MRIECECGQSYAEFGKGATYKLGGLTCSVCGKTLPPPEGTPVSEPMEPGEAGGDITLHNVHATGEIFIKGGDGAPGAGGAAGAGRIGFRRPDK